MTYRGYSGVRASCSLLKKASKMFVLTHTLRERTPKTYLITVGTAIPELVETTLQRLNVEQLEELGECLIEVNSLDEFMATLPPITEE